jgi:hypothetical protein
MMKNYTIGKSIYPDVDGTDGINKFLEKFNIQVRFLFDNGINFYYPEDTIEPYKISEGAVYFKDINTRSNLLYYYEDFEELVFKNMITEEIFRIPIFDLDLGV